MLKGIVKKYSRKRGTGLITALATGMVIAFDQTSIAADSVKLPETGDIVEFILPESDERNHALFVRIANPDEPLEPWV